MDSNLQLQDRSAVRPLPRTDEACCGCRCDSAHRSAATAPNITAPGHSSPGSTKECTMLRSTLPTLLALAAALLAGGCNLDRPDMDDGVVPTAMAAAPVAPKGQEV